MLSKYTSSTFGKLLKSGSRIQKGQTRILFSNMGQNRGFAYEKFNYKDPLAFDGLLTEEERLVEETARKYA